MEQTDLEPRKLFVGGLPRWGLTAEHMRAHFARYGHVVDALVMLFPNGMGRGFGFVEFEDEVAALRALDVRQRDEHDAFFGRRVDVKKAQKKQGIRYAPTPSTTYNHQNADSKKIFVGGLGDKITKDDLSSYFENFGTITDAVVFYDKLTRKARGFGFVTFDSQEAADKVLENNFHELKGIRVETKSAEPRGSMVKGTWIHRSPRSPANSYDGMYTPYNIPFVTGPYLLPFSYYSPPGIINYAYMMNQMGTSNDTGMMAMPHTSTRYAHHERSYGSEVASLKLETGQQRIDISASAGMKSDPLKPDSNLL